VGLPHAIRAGLGHLLFGPYDLEQTVEEPNDRLHADPPRAIPEVTHFDAARLRELLDRGVAVEVGHVARRAPEHAHARVGERGLGPAIDEPKLGWWRWVRGHGS